MFQILSIHKLDDSIHGALFVNERPLTSRNNRESDFEEAVKTAAWIWERYGYRLDSVYIVEENSAGKYVVPIQKVAGK